MNDFTLKFDLQPLKELDQLALLACQKYNYGNESDWFNAFRGGLYGSIARIHGVVKHYFDIHAWLPKAWSTTENEYHIASIFFNMDSTVECFTFSLNAFGYGVDPLSFRDLTDHQQLKKINPQNIIGRSELDSTNIVVGYNKIFSTVQKHWMENRNLLEIITEQHDVSKHRETIFSGGNMRNDPPEGFYEMLGIGSDPTDRSMLKPMAEIILRSDPKTPHVNRISQSKESQLLLEDIVNQFRNFFVITVKSALEDAKRNIPLSNTN